MNTLEESAGKILTAISVSGRRERPIGPFCIGTVLVGSQEGSLPARGAWIEITTAAEDLWINEDLLEGYSPKLVGALPGTCPDGGTLTPVSADQLTRGEFALKAGDRVVLLTLDGQDYYLLAKAVRL